MEREVHILEPRGHERDELQVCIEFCKPRVSEDLILKSVVMKGTCHELRHLQCVEVEMFVETYEPSEGDLWGHLDHEHER